MKYAVGALARERNLLVEVSVSNRQLSLKQVKEEPDTQTKSAPTATEHKTQNILNRDGLELKLDAKIITSCSRCKQHSNKICNMALSCEATSAFLSSRLSCSVCPDVSRTGLAWRWLFRCTRLACV